MTEAEWFASTDPVPMLTFVQGKISDRRLRLFVVVCCRCLWGSSSDPAVGVALEVAEHLADAGRVQSDPAIVRVPAGEVVVECSASDPIGVVRFPNGEITELLKLPGPYVRTILTILSCRSDIPPTVVSYLTEAGLCPDRQAPLLRDIVRYPARPLTLQTEWLYLNNATVRQMAEGIRAAQAYDRLPFLADALEDAGCHEEELLRHCRSNGEHVRGCWALDFLLGRL